jgi:PKD repeat protein
MIKIIIHPNQLQLFMKKIITLCAMIMVVSVTFGQAIQRTMVVQEIGTGTWCQYCPGAAMGADDLITNGCQVAVIEYHNGDSFTNSYSDARNAYYGITGFPTAFFDGVLSFVGGSHTASMYSNYLPLYNQRYAIPSPCYMDISGTHTGDVYTVVLSIHKTAAITGTDLRAHLVLTESNISYSWQGQTELNYVERTMVPSDQGTPVSFTSGDMQIIVLTFTKDASWVTANCELVAFLQDNLTKEVLNGNKVALTALPAPVSVNFTANSTTGCVPLSVAFTDQSSGVNAWKWNFEGGTPSSSTVQNPTVSYATAGTDSVTLTAWSTTSWRGNKMVKPAYINPITVPVAPGTPQGNSGMCSNPGTQVYSSSGAPSATSYNWDLQPPSSGVVTNNGQTCSIAWNSSFTGSATLKVQGVNTCGTGSWSPDLTITISQQPSQAGTPTGTTTLCEDAPNTIYSTTGATPATSYVWEISPSTAGQLQPNGTQCSVDWTQTFTGTAQIRVKGVNVSCEGSWSNWLTVTVISPPSIYSLTGGGTYCATSGTGLPVGLTGSETGVNYTLMLNGVATTTVIPGTGSTLSFGNQTQAGTYTVTAANTSITCNSTMNGSAVIAVDPQIPDVPGTPAGPVVVHTGTTQSSDYTTAGGTYATTFVWDLSPVNSGTIAGTGTTGTVTWNTSYNGTAQVKVKGSNSCGESTFSNTLDVTVDNLVGIPETQNTGSLQICPNPARDILTLITGKNVKSDIRVFNSIGSVLISKPETTINSRYTLDISSLSAGVYFISVRSDEGNVTRKFVVER